MNRREQTGSKGERRRKQDHHETRIANRLLLWGNEFKLVAMIGTLVLSLVAFQKRAQAMETAQCFKDLFQQIRKDEAGK